MLGVHRLDSRGLSINLSGEHGDSFGSRGLLDVELGHAAGEDNAKACAELIAQCTVTLGLGGLALEGGHLAGDFFEDVVDARQVVTGGFEAKFGETLLGLEACDPGGLFKDRATVKRL